MELCGSAGAGTVTLAGARSLIARVKVESIMTDRTSSEIDELSAAYLSSKFSANVIIQKLG